MAMREAGVRLKVREDAERGLVFAFLARAEDDPLDGGEALLLGAISLGVCRRFPTLFEDWKELMTRAMARTFEEATGQKVLDVFERRPNER